MAAAAIALGLYAEPHSPTPASASGPTYPRVPQPSADLPALLDQLGVGSPTWYAAIVAFPFLLWGARRLDTERLGHARSLALSGAFVVTAITLVSTFQYMVLFREAPVRPGWIAYLPVALRQNALPWIALAGIVAGIEWRRRALRSVLDRERLRAELAEQRLIALTAQLQPHFLFNTLQGISTLIHRDPEAADDMLGKLSELLSALLRHRDHAVVSLEDEVRYARTYLEIAKVRFAERLEFTIDVPADLYDAAVPLFLLQPLVENALTHGIGTKLRGGRIGIRARLRDGRLIIEVADVGALPGDDRGSTLEAALGGDGGRAVSGANRGDGDGNQGIGLSNTRARLREVFGEDQTLVLERRPAGEVVVQVDVPFRSYRPPVSREAARSVGAV